MIKYLFLIDCLTFGLIVGNFLRGATRTSVTAKSEVVESRPEVTKPTAPVEEMMPSAGRSAAEQLVANLAAHPAVANPVASPDANEILLGSQAIMACQGFKTAQFPDLMETISMRDWGFLEKVSALRMVAQQWAATDPRAALAAIEWLPNELQKPTLETLWTAWARADFAGLHEFNLEKKNSGKPYTKPSEAQTKADPAYCMGVMLGKDLQWFAHVPNTSFPDRPVEISFLPEGMDPAKTTGGYTDVNVGPSLRSWLHRDPAAAIAWTRDAIISQTMHPGLEYFLLNLLSQEGAHHAAAQLATEHLPRPMAEALLKKILPRWQAQDGAGVDAWKAAMGG
jgi:hypothetical protein